MNILIAFILRLFRNIASRIERRLISLDEKSVASNPIKQFQQWYDEAVRAKFYLHEAMTLATATPNGKPSARLVLLKQADDNGFVFYTNYNSRKGAELIDNPFAALVFHWAELHRQIRIEGKVEKVSAEESEQYFHSRPRDSQLGAWASPQSNVVSGREELERMFEELTQQYGDKPIPLPPHWGGFRLKPTTIEFWQGRASRLHDRIVYELQSDGRWSIKRLAP